MNEHSSSRRALGFASAVVLAYFGVEVAGALISGSLALLADAGHTVSDVLALGLASAAAWLATRPGTASRSFGFMRAEILVALTNGVILLTMAALIVFEAAQRMAAPPEVRGGIVSAVASGGIAANVIAATLLLRSSRSSLNVRAALFHVGGDALGSLAAGVAGVLVLVFGWRIADPILSVVIALILVYGAVRIVREATHVLLEGTPAHVDVASLRADIEDIEHVEGCHDLHIWTITSGYHALSAHVTIADECTGECVRTLQDELHVMMHARYAIGHVTIQLERGDGGACDETHVPEAERGRV